MDKKQLEIENMLVSMEDSLEKADYMARSLIPLSRGGTNEFSNLQPACLTCNIMKGNLEVSEFFGKLKEIYKFSKRQRFHKIIVGDKIW